MKCGHCAMSDHCTGPSQLHSQRYSVTPPLLTYHVVLQGEFQGGLMDGFGIFTSGSINTAAGTSPLRRYEGGWKHDAPNGFGVEIKLATGPDDTGGRYYEGEWVDGMQHGHGIELRPDGRRCAPCIVAVAAAYACANPLFSRSGAMMQFECIDRYDGEWLDGAQHGDGVTSTAHGEVSWLCLCRATQDCWAQPQQNVKRCCAVC